MKIKQSKKNYKMKENTSKFLKCPKIGQIIKVYMNDKEFKFGKVVGIDHKEAIRYNDYNGQQHYKTNRKEINGEIVIERIPQSYKREIVLLKELNKTFLPLDSVDYCLYHYVCRFV